MLTMGIWQSGMTGADRLKLITAGCRGGCWTHQLGIDHQKLCNQLWLIAIVYWGD